MLCVRAVDAEKLTQLRFSPDGQYVLAQDNSGIDILTVHPFEVLFRIPAQNGDNAEFTPDSHQVVFIKPQAKVDQFRVAFTGSASYAERWSIAERTRIARWTLPSLVCRAEKLSPDGATLACLDLKRRLRVFDVASHRPVFEKRRFVYALDHDDLDDSATSHALASAQFDFSTDGRFLLARPNDGEGSPVAWDTREKREVRLTGPLRELKTNGSLFVGPDRVLIRSGALSVSDYTQGFETVKIVSFPAGRLLSRPRIPIGPIVRASDPNFLLVDVSNQDNPRATAFDLTTGRLIAADRHCLDVSGHYYVSQPDESEVGLYEIGTGLKARVALKRK